MATPVASIPSWPRSDTPSRKDKDAIAQTVAVLIGKRRLRSFTQTLTQALTQALTQFQTLTRTPTSATTNSRCRFSRWPSTRRALYRDKAST
jgi:hypothetical protein